MKRWPIHSQIQPQIQPKFNPKFNPKSNPKSVSVAPHMPHYRRGQAPESARASMRKRESKHANAWARSFKVDCLSSLQPKRVNTVLSGANVLHAPWRHETLTIGEGATRKMIACWVLCAGWMLGIMLKDGCWVLCRRMDVGDCAD
jgi:hypothetical protein